MDLGDLAATVAVAIAICATYWARMSARAARASARETRRIADLEAERRSEERERRREERERHAEERERRREERERYVDEWERRHEERTPPPLDGITTKILPASRWRHVMVPRDQDPGSAPRAEDLTSKLDVVAYLTLPLPRGYEIEIQHRYNGERARFTAKAGQEIEVVLARFDRGQKPPPIFAVDILFWPPRSDWKEPGWRCLCGRPERPDFYNGSLTYGARAAHWELLGVPVDVPKYSQWLEASKPVVQPEKNQLLASSKLAIRLEEIRRFGLPELDFRSKDSQRPATPNSAG